MRKATWLLALASCLAFSSWTRAKPPEPIECPTDIGFALAETCPCDGTVAPDLTVESWRNHGHYVRCVVQYRNALRKAGCFTDDSLRRTLARCAARSTCGKTTKLRCCNYELGTCSDPAPGDLTPAGTCSNDVALVCDTDADCAKSAARLVGNPDACLEDGGTLVDGGSVCEPCPPPPAP